MKIDLALWHLQGYAGTQTWAYTLAHAFRQMGHDVAFYCESFGRLGMRLIAEGFEVLTHRQRVPRADFHIVSQPRMFLRCPSCGKYAPPDADMKALEHRTEKGEPCPGGELINFLPKGKRVYVSHGWLEHEAPVDDGSPYFVVSPEQQARLKRLADLDSTVIPQPIDLERFKPRSHRREHKGHILLLSTWPAEDGILAQAVAQTSSRLLKSPMGGQTWDIPEWINEAATVIGTGRGIAEAMACDRMPVICGQFGCDGVVTPRDIEKQAEFNFSGRWQKLDPEAALVPSLSTPFDVPDGWWRAEAERRFEPTRAAKMLLEAAC